MKDITSEGAVMKTQEELKNIKEEYEALNRKLAELTDDELEQVTGGTKRQLFQALNQLLQQSIEKQNCIGQNINEQNIANATSEGYSRQRVNQSCLSPERRTYNQADNQAVK